MRIAQVAPLYESVPPKLYGGTEWVVSYLTEALVDAGHDVTLFASADSRTRAELVPMCDRSLRLNDGCSDPVAQHLAMTEAVYRHGRFDVVHFHIDYLHFPASARSSVPHLTTLHGRLDLPGLAPLYRAFPGEPVVSISDFQRRPLPGANWLGTVYHGLPAELLPLRRGGGGYLAFIGRLSIEKRPDLAIEIAKRVDMPLRIAAKLDKPDVAYFEREIRPLLDDPEIQWIGEIGEDEKGAFLGDAAAVLFPIDWPEPFGLIMIEAMACGTPVIAFRRGSVPEVLEDGVTGYIVDDVDGAVQALRRIGGFDRARCRREFERRFTSDRMVRDYLQLYRTLRG